MRHYLGTAFLARLADEGLALAVVLLALGRGTGAADGAFVLTAWTAPHALSAPLTGALAARTRRPGALYATALAAFAAAIAGVALTLGRLPLPCTLAIALVGGCCGPVVSGGLSSAVAVIAPEGPARARAYALDSAVYNAASAGGPALVGLAAAVVSPAAATGLLANAAACAALMVRGLPLAAGPEREAPVRTAREGVRCIWRSRELRAVTACTTLAYLGMGALNVTTVLYVRSLGHSGAEGVPLTAFAVGALAGSLPLARGLARIPAHRLALCGMAGTGVCLAAAALCHSLPAAFPLTVAFFACAGAFDGPLLTATLRTRADNTRKALRTQVFTLGAGLKISAMAGGSALAGLAAHRPADHLLLAVAALPLAASVLYPVLRRPPGRGGTGGRAAYSTRSSTSAIDSTICEGR